MAYGDLVGICDVDLTEGSTMMKYGASPTFALRNTTIKPKSIITTDLNQCNEASSTLTSFSSPTSPHSAHSEPRLGLNLRLSQSHDLRQRVVELSFLVVVVL